MGCTNIKVLMRHFLWPLSLYSIFKGTSRNNEQNISDSLLRRPSLSSQLLGKRKASTPVREQPDRKRSTVESPHQQSSEAEVPTTSFSHKPEQSTNVERPKKAVDTEPTQSECGDGRSSDSKALPARDVPQDISIQQNQRKSGEVISVDESDSSNEVDICDAPPLTTPRKNTQVTGTHASPMKPVSPANSDSFPGISALGKDKSPVHHVSNTPLIFPKHPAATSGSPSRTGIFSRSGSKNNSPVPCHYCPKTGYQPAVKTCLVCGASMCTEHLRPHLDSPVFQNHTLVPPMEDISSWRCQEHQEINRIYCRQCGVCVCTVCTVIGSHRNHVCISIREAESELRVSDKSWNNVTCRWIAIVVKVEMHLNVVVVVIFVKMYFNFCFLRETWKKRSNNCKTLNSKWKIEWLNSQRRKRLSL